MMHCGAFLEFPKDSVQYLLKNRPPNIATYKCCSCNEGYTRPYGPLINNQCYFICLLCGKWELRCFSDILEGCPDEIQEEWNKIFRNQGNRKIVYDLWLDKHEQIIKASLNTPIIDLGCGYGNDTLYLYERGYCTVSCDFSIESLDRLSYFILKPNLILLDLCDGLPFLNNTAKVIIADLSLHYFSWEKTKFIVQEISRVLTDKAYLLCRVNSVNDKNHGAGEGFPIEENFYNLNGKLKRFFNKISLEELFSDWEITYLMETELHRFENKKVLWELAIRKQG